MKASTNWPPSVAEVSCLVSARRSQGVALVSGIILGAILGAVALIPASPYLPFAVLR